jgi:hypothetical protein
MPAYRILIKVSSTLGKTRTSASEDHTVYSFVRWLSPYYSLYISGLELSSPLAIDLVNLGAVILPPRIRYLDHPFHTLFHIPVAIFNCVSDSIAVRPSLSFCTGGVFYNGLSLVIASFFARSGTYFVRTAEDSWACFFLSLFPLNRNTFKLFIIALLNHFVLLFSKNILTVGPASHHLLTHFPYFLNEKRVKSIPGPVDNKIVSYIPTDSSPYRSYNKTPGTILFVSNGSVYKGTDTMLLLADALERAGLEFKIIWISTCSQLPNHLTRVLSHPYIHRLPPQSRPSLAELITNVDFTLFATRLKIGYGQILLESLLLGTEPIIINPIGDCLSQFPVYSYTSIQEVTHRLATRPLPEAVVLPDSMHDISLSSRHSSYISSLLNA